MLASMGGRDRVVGWPGAPERCYMRDQSLGQPPSRQKHGTAQTNAFARPKARAVRRTRSAHSTRHTGMARTTTSRVTAYRGNICHCMRLPIWSSGTQAAPPRTSCPDPPGPESHLNVPFLSVTFKSLARSVKSNSKFVMCEDPVVPATVSTLYPSL